MSVGGYQVSDGVKLTLRAMSDWVASILISCPANTYLVDNGIGMPESGQKAECKTCPRANVYTDEDTPLTGTTVQTESSGGQSTTCTCPDTYEDYYKQDE